MKPAKTGQFSEIISLIQKAKSNAMKSVNQELIGLYWNIGKYISHKIESAEWGESVIEKLAKYIAKAHPDFKGYTRSNLYRMKQFYEIYKITKIPTLLGQISWTKHFLIISKSKISFIY